MVAIPATNQVGFIYMNCLRTSAECDYLRNQVDRVQHEVGLLEVALFSFLGILATAAAAALILAIRDWCVSYSEKQTGLRRGTVPAKSQPLNRMETQTEPGAEYVARHDNAVRWIGLILFWAAYNGGIYCTYVFGGSDWRHILLGTLVLQSFVALAAFYALWKPRFRGAKPTDVKGSS
jgi:hypothetical protein